MLHYVRLLVTFLSAVWQKVKSWFTKTFGEQKESACQSGFIRHIFLLSERNIFMTPWHVKVHRWITFEVDLHFCLEIFVFLSLNVTHVSSWLRTDKICFCFVPERIESLKEPEYEMQNQINLSLYFLAVSERSCNHTFTVSPAFSPFFCFFFWTASLKRAFFSGCVQGDSRVWVGLRAWTFSCTRWFCFCFPLCYSIVAMVSALTCV